MREEDLGGLRLLRKGPFNTCNREQKSVLTVDIEGSHCVGKPFETSPFVSLDYSNPLMPTLQRTLRMAAGLSHYDFKKSVQT